MGSFMIDFTATKYNSNGGLVFYNVVWQFQKWKRKKKKGRENDIELLLTAIHLLTFFHFAMVKKKSINGYSQVHKKNNLYIMDSAQWCAEHYDDSENKYFAIHIIFF